MALTATLDTTLSRVRLHGTSLTGASTALFERSSNNLYWTTVRGGTAKPVVSNVADLDDYEFVPNQVNYYRVTAGASIYTTNTTPSQSGIWFKSIYQPFLNRAVKVIDYSDIARPARNGIFEIVGRSNPIAVTDVRSSRRWNMKVQTLTVSDADAFEQVLASGDPLYVQTDGLHDVPAGYVVVGDMTRSRYGYRSAARFFDLPMTVVAAPGPSIVGSTATWETLVAEYGSWTAVLSAFGTWADVVEHVSDPDVIYVP